MAIWFGNGVVVGILLTLTVLEVVVTIRRGRSR